jgi:capsular exopolysaccharide synthesis family protein
VAAQTTSQIPETDLRELLRILWRRRWLMTATVAVILAVAFAALSQMTPRYTAVAQVMVDPRQSNVLDVEQVVSGLPANAETIQSEIEVMTSRTLAAKVVTALKLEEKAEFNPATRPAQGLAAFWAALTEVPASQAGSQRNQVTDKFLRRLDVRVAGRSRVINVSFTSSDPALAAQAANTVADLYLVEQLEAKFEATRSATNWLSSRLEDLQRKAEAAELAAVRLKAQVAAAPALENTETTVRLRTLEREAQASRALYEAVLVRFKETSEQQGLQQADARIISRADAPVRPSFPNESIFLLLALTGALGLALLFAFAAEKIDNGFRSSDQVEALLGLPTIAMLPALRSLGIKGSQPEQYVTDKPSSSMAEAVRMLRTSLLLSSVDQPPRVLLLTSALPGEGKTTVALMLARLASFSGEKVILIDADLRRPRIHSALQVENTAGLVELLSGQAPIEKVLRTSDVAGRSVHFISAGQATPHATELVRSQQMRRFIRSLAGMYSLVIIDGPPVLPVADAKVLATQVDRVLHVVRWSETPRQVVAQSVRQLKDVGANLAGIVLNGVDVRRHAEYSYSDSGYYYGRYRKYYAD